MSTRSRSRALHVPIAWGMEAGELMFEFPCDRYVRDFDIVVYRGVTIESNPDVVFRWLCQLRVAPYSYDWIDNLGRRSPRQLIPGLEKLEVGQRMMLFELIDFEPNRHLTLRTRPNDPSTRVYGNMVGSYLLVQKGPNRCRLLAKLFAKTPNSALGKLVSRILPWGDMVMTRRQLLNFKNLSEKTGTVGALFPRGS